MQRLIKICVWPLPGFMRWGASRASMATFNNPAGDEKLNRPDGGENESKSWLKWSQYKLKDKMMSMSAAQVRKSIKKVIDQLPADRLSSLSDYVQFLSRPPLAKRVSAAEKSIATGKGVNWRKVRKDV